MGQVASVCFESAISMRAIGAGSIPEIGTPEWRTYVQTPEYQESLRDQALQDDKDWEDQRRHDESMAQLYQETPVRELGATGICAVNVFRRDFREQFTPDHPERMDYEEEIFGKTETELIAEDVIRIGKLHDVILRCTRIDYGQ